LTKKIFGRKLSHKSQNGSTKYKTNFWVAESGSSFEPPRLKVAQHWTNCSKISTLAQKRLKFLNVAQKGPKKLSLSFIKFLLGGLFHATEYRVAEFSFRFP
jgi:hypothetical protein